MGRGAFTLAGTNTLDCIASKDGTIDAPERRERFASVYEDNFARVYGFIGYRVRSREEADDLTQVVFEKALRAYGRFDPTRASHSTWLISIARNVLIDHFRRRREDLLGDQAVARAIDADSLADRAPELVSPELADALESLSPRERTVLALRFGADLTGREIADVLDLSTDNVHQILSRSLRRLRLKLAEMG